MFYKILGDSGGKSCYLNIFSINCEKISGPLRRLSDNRLIGIVSNGHGCALKNYPGIYSNVASVRNWISSTVNLE